MASSSAPKSSPRPRARPDNLGSKRDDNGGGTLMERLKRSFSKAGGTGGAVLGGQTNANSGGDGANTKAKSDVKTAPPPSRPDPTNNPDTVAKAAPKVAPDTSILTKALRDAAVKGGGKSYRGSILSSLYGLPSDSQRAVRTLQSFNGPQGSRLKLGQ